MVWQTALIFRCAFRGSLVATGYRKTFFQFRVSRLPCPILVCLGSDKLNGVYNDANAIGLLRRYKDTFGS